MAGLKRSLAMLWLALGALDSAPAWADAPPTAPAMLLAEVYAADVDVTQYFG